VIAEARRPFNDRSAFPCPMEGGGEQRRKLCPQPINRLKVQLKAGERNLRH
jgi:hypothetical protein